MSILRILGLGALATMPLYAPAEATRAKAPEPVAIVYSLAGEASLAAPNAARRTLRRFDRLPARTTVEVRPRSRLALAFMNGLRYELGERSRVTLGPKGLASRTGLVRALPRLPPLPRLSPISEEDNPGPRAGAVRIRAERIAGLYPRRGAATLAGKTTLVFQPLKNAGGYRIEVHDGQGRTVFRTDTESPPIKVPAGALRPGLSYQWTVRTLNRPGAVASGEAEFVTLSQNAARMREKTREVLEAEGPGSLPLLAEIDCGLGLLLEAREELRTALDGVSGDPALREVLAEIERRLEDKDDSD
ncbi:MAG TPA: hypothetical protein VGG03_03520 [Thermoanaerobaculia bacterium]|jgi:hypothetical protein